MSLTILTATLALGLQQQADVSQKVTFSHTGGSLPKVLAELGGQTKLAFDVHPDVAKEVVFVQVSDQPLSAVLDKIAFVCGGKWFDQAGVIKLIVDPQARAREDQLVANKRLEGVRRGKKLLDERSKPEKYEDEGETFETTPDAGTILINEIISQIPDMVLAAVKPGERVVFATTPTRMQRAMPRFNMARVNAWVKEHNDSIGAMEAVPPEMEEFQKLFGDRFTPKKFEGQPAEMMLIVSSSTNMWGSGLTARLAIFDSNGKSALETSASLVDGDPMGMAEMAVPAGVGDESTGKPPAEEKSTPIQYPKEYEDLIKSFEAGDNARGVQTEQFRQYLLHPEVHEPLAIPFGWALTCASRQSKVSMVGTLADDDGVFYGGKIHAVEDLKGQLLDKLDESQPGWWVVKPADPNLARNARIDRNVLAGFLAICEKANPTLDQFAEFLASSTGEFENSMVNMRIQTVRPGMGGNIFGGLDMPGVRMYGLLSQGQRAQLKQDRQIPFAGLSTKARAQAVRMLFGADSTGLTEFDSTAPQGRKSVLDDMSQIMSFGMAGGRSSLQLEPTEVMPDGLPGNGFLSATVENKPYVMALSEKGGANEFTIPLGIDELAMFRLMMQQPEFAAEGQQFMANFEQMQRGTRDEWTIRMHVAPAAVRLINLDDLKPLGGDKFSIRQLPDDLEASVNQRANKLKDSPFFKMIAMGASMGGQERIKP